MLRERLPVANDLVTDGAGKVDVHDTVTVDMPDLACFPIELRAAVAVDG